MGFQISQTLGLVAGIKRQGDIKMGFFHAFYGMGYCLTHGFELTDKTGLGALSAPFVATQFAHMRHWSYHYLISLCLAIVNTISFSTIIGFKTKDGMVCVVAASIRRLLNFYQSVSSSWAKMSEKRVPVRIVPSIKSSVSRPFIAWHSLSYFMSVLKSPLEVCPRARITPIL